MLRSRRLAAGVTALALAVTGPAVAFAQGAGDNQYADPFAGAHLKHPKKHKKKRRPAKAHAGQACSPKKKAPKGFKCKKDRNGKYRLVKG